MFIICAGVCVLFVYLLLLLMFVCVCAYVCACVCVCVRVCVCVFWQKYESVRKMTLPVQRGRKTSRRKAPHELLSVFFVAVSPAKDAQASSTGDSVTNSLSRDGNLVGYLVGWLVGWLLLFFPRLSVDFLDVVRCSWKGFVSRKRRH